MSSLQNKVVVVTGGSEGIGRALVESLLQQGAKVATCSRNYDKLYQLQTLNPNKPLFIYQADVSSEQDCHTFIDKVVKLYGTIDILVNNAGISMRGLFAETDLETLRKVMDVNFWGTVYCTKFALPYILQQKGSIVGISSVAGYRGLPGRSGYSASKFAVNGWMEALRTELMESGVNVIWVCPGFTASNIRNAALNEDAKPMGEGLMDEGKMMTAEECAGYILQAIEKRKRTLVLTGTGKQAVFMNRFFPALADKLVRKFYYKEGKLVK
ncbi:Short-chain dehydrogenase [Filimonas lacunae]|uniref:Short-chain dehydrogenase n=1 Tax=Filimonas lacunae TaxID=477680 RepID=A0A173MDJ3_9BACT|nr:SDR family oxidoreductase [Filimonas lacunae]BAV05587.1 short chain dehydrogenase [Filimonas lacunae]SIT29283.1 Short-chain dehydrogenase [Filimonas lacunae]